jgi:hypothetical protein
VLKRIGLMNILIVEDDTRCANIITTVGSPSLTLKFSNLMWEGWS